MKLKFSKMHGLGNDFVVIDGVSQPFAPSVVQSAARVRALGDRHFGIGFDQLLLVEKSTLPNVDFRYRIFNADGGEVEQCGNGARCFARFVVHAGLSTQREITVETLRGIIRPRLEDGGEVTVDMGPPRFAAAEIPFESTSEAVVQPLEVDGQTLAISALSMGNPHAVLVVADVDTAPVATLGPAIEAHPRFPARVNAGFMQVVDPHRIRLRVFERGAGETLACGTGACAAVVAGIRRRLLSSPVRVETRGGSLTIAWAGEAQPVMMTGPAQHVFDGEIDLAVLDNFSANILLPTSV